MRFRVTPISVGWGPCWYWSRLDEPVDSHGPYMFRWVAALSAVTATGF